MSIERVEDLIRPHLNDDQKIISYDCKSFLTPGENYGSVILGLNIKVKNRKGQEETIQCVAKTTPPSQHLWELFNIKVTFKKEIEFYVTIVPTLNDFAQENGVRNLMHSAIKCLGARISLDPKSNAVDKDAVFVLENLKEQGYVVGDRFTGVNFDTAKLVLDALAVLHAAPIALKLARPEVFETKLRPHLVKGILYEPSDVVLDSLIQNVQKLAARDSRCASLMSRIDLSLRRMKDLYLHPKVTEPLATFQHQDVWTNNIMIKFQGQKPVAVKLFDYQTFVYGSPLRDVLFFLYSSVELEIIENKMDELVRYYYDKLIETFAKLNCVLSTTLSFEALMEEADEMAKDTELSHIVFMLTIIFTRKSEAKELKDWTPDSLPPDESILHQNYFKRLHFVIRDFARRNWI